MEEWKPIKGFEGLYEVSNHGNVISVARKSANKGSYSGEIKIKERVLKQTTNKLGYKVLTLFKNGKRHFRIVHRLVAEAFIENPNNYLEVNHKDLNKSNNRTSNLEWCNRSQNVNHYLQKTNKTSKYKGVSYSSQRKKWCAYIDLNKKRISLGRFNSEEEANNYRTNFINQLKNIKHETFI